jgi:hypothetical protein
MKLKCTFGRLLVKSENCVLKKAEISENKPYSVGFSNRIRASFSFQQQEAASPYCTFSKCLENSDLNRIKR